MAARADTYLADEIKTGTKIGDVNLDRIAHASGQIEAALNSGAKTHSDPWSGTRNRGPSWWGQLENRGVKLPLRDVTQAPSGQVWAYAVGYKKLRAGASQ